MWFKKTVFPAMAVLIAATTFSANQAYALNDDEAAVLVGLAVGSLAAVAVKHHREHDRSDWQQRERYREDRHRHDRYRENKRVEHYVIHNPPSHRHGHKQRHDNYCKHADKHSKTRNRGHVRSGYEYEYEYKRRVRF